MPQLTKVLADWHLWGLSSTPITAHQCRHLAGGLTNQAYVIQLPQGAWVLRLAGGAHLDISRAQEAKLSTYLAQAGLLPHLTYIAPNFSYWLRPFIVGRALTAPDFTFSCLQHLVLELKQIHALPISIDLPHLNIATKAASYWQQLAQQGIPQSILALQERTSTIVQPLAGQHCLCHLDPTPANWILTPSGQLTLLDWEYAALGHPLWDLAVLLGSANLSPQQELKLLASYGWHDVQAWPHAKQQMRYLEILWYALQGIYTPAQLETGLLELIQL